MKSNNLFLALTTLMLAFSLLSCSGDSSSGNSSTEIIYVDNSNTTGIEDGSYENPYSTIQEAIDSASGENTLVYIRKGNMPYAVEDGFLVDLEGTKNVTLWGSGYNEGFPGIAATGYPVLQSSTLTQERPIHMEDVENISIIGLDLRGGKLCVVYAAAAKKLTIKHCIISGAEYDVNWIKTSGIVVYSWGSELHGSDKSSDITITNNTIFDNDIGGVNISVFGGGDYGADPAAENVLIAENTFFQTEESVHTMHLPIICEIWDGHMEDITIENNDIDDFGEGSAWTPAGIYFLQRETENPVSNNIIIRNNNILKSFNDSMGISVEVSSGKMENLVVSGNSVSNTGRGIALIAPGAGGEPGSGGGAIVEAVVTENTITNSLDPDTAGLLLVALEDGNLSASVFRNVIKDGTGFGVWLDRGINAMLAADLGGGPFQSEGYNSIYNNQPGEIGIRDQNVGPQTAKNNWWGQADDPGSLIQGDIDYTPWLTEDPN